MTAKKQPQPKFFVNDKDFIKEAEALNELANQKTAKAKIINYIDVKAKQKKIYTLKHHNYHVAIEVYTPTASTASVTDNSNDRDNADSLPELQPTVE